MLVTEPHPDLSGVVAQAVAGGVNVVQLRDKTAGRFAHVRTALDLWDVTRPPTLLVVNGADEYAARKSADGTQLSIEAARLLPPQHGHWFKGISVHTVGEAVEAEQLGADYLIAGTIFASQSHPDVAPQGANYLREVCKAVTIPVIAIGGVTPARVAECVAAGAAGVAVLSPIMRAADPQAAAREYRQALDAAWKAISCT